MAVDREKTLRVTGKLTPIAMSHGDRAWAELQKTRLEDPALVLIAASSSILATVVKGSSGIVLFHLLGMLVRMFRVAAPQGALPDLVQMLRVEWRRQVGGPAFEERDRTQEPDA